MLDDLEILGVGLVLDFAEAGEQVLEETEPVLDQCVVGHREDVDRIVYDLGQKSLEVHLQQLLHEPPQAGGRHPILNLPQDLSQQGVDVVQGGNGAGIDGSIEKLEDGLGLLEGGVVAGEQDGAEVQPESERRLVYQGQVEVIRAQQVLLLVYVEYLQGFGVDLLEAFCLLGVCLPELGDHPVVLSIVGQPLEEYPQDVLGLVL